MIFPSPGSPISSCRAQKRVFTVFGPLVPSEGAIFSKDVAVFCHARGYFAQPLRAGTCFWASGQGCSKIFSAVSLGKFALILPPRSCAFCGVAVRARNCKIDPRARTGAFFPEEFHCFQAGNLLLALASDAPVKDQNGGWLEAFETRRGLAHFAMPVGSGEHSRTEQNVPVPFSADGSRARNSLAVHGRWLAYRGPAERPP